MGTLPVFRLANDVGQLAPSTIERKVRELEQRIDSILTWKGPCAETAGVIRKLKNARDQLLVFVGAPEFIGPTNNVSERLLRPAVINRKVTNGFRSKQSADDDCMVRSVVDTARLSGASPYQTIRNTLAL